MEDTREENHCQMCCEPETSSDSTDWRRTGLLRDGPGMCAGAVNEFGKMRRSTEYGRDQSLIRAAEEGNVVQFLLEQPCVTGQCLR